MKKSLALLLLATWLLTSCGGTAQSGETGEAADTDAAQTEAETEKEGYDYTGIDYGGHNFQIINMDNIYSMHTLITREEINGEVLNDALYTRNAFVEENMNIKITELVTPADNYFAPLLDTIRTAVTAGDNTYDMAFVPPTMGADVLTGSYLYNLKDIGCIDLSSPWYNQSYNDTLTVYGTLPAGMSSASIMLYDSYWVLFFNEDMITDRGMEMPYDLVREGKWTFDKLHEYCLDAAALGGDESYAWNRDGSAVYGMSIKDDSPYKFMVGLGAAMVRNENGEIRMAADTEAFSNALDTCVELLSFADGAAYLGANSDMDADKGGYIYAFTAERALFLTAEVCKSQNFRELEFTYGLLPFPKNDETQQNYTTSAYNNAFVFGFPVSCSDVEMSAKIMDAISYESMVQVVPEYIGSVVEHKGLRNEESVEMLEIAMQNTHIDIGLTFGFGKDLHNAVNGEVKSKTGSGASLIAAQKTAIETGIASLAESWGK